MKLLPSRFKALKDAEDDTSVVVDLDKIAVEKVAFKWNGKTHYIKPLTTVEFLKASDAFAKMALLAEKKEHNFEELISVYAELFSSVCDTIGKKEIMQMSQPQVAALYQLVIDTVRGRVKETEKKSHLNKEQEKAISK